MFSNHNRNPGPKRRFFFVLIPLFFLLIFSAVVMLLWNAILPEVLQVRTISYWQAAGLLVLCRILFGGFRFGGNSNRNRFKGPPAHLKNKWMNMGDDEKQKFKEEWKKRCDQRKQRPEP